MEIIEKDGKKFQVTVQKVCKICKKIELRCKCGSKKEIEEIKSFYEITPESTRRSDLNEVEKIISEPKPICPNCNRILERCHCAKLKRNEENAKILNMDEEEVNEKVDKDLKEQKEKMEDVIKERNNIALNNVQEIMDLKKSMAAEKKSSLEIKNAIKELKDKQKYKLAEKEEIDNPIKCPKCGEIYSDGKEHNCK